MRLSFLALSGIEVDVGTTEQGSETGNGSAGNPGADDPKLGVFSNESEVLRLYAQADLDGEVLGIEVDRLDDSDTDVSAADFGFIDDDSFGVVEGHGDEFSLLLNGAIDQPETQKEPNDGDDPNFTNTPTEFDFRFGGFR